MHQAPFGCLIVLQSYRSPSASLLLPVLADIVGPILCSRRFELHLSGWHGQQISTPFLCSCIHSLSTSGGYMVLRPFGLDFHNTFLNRILQFDHIDTSPSLSGKKYVFLRWNDHFDYGWFDFCADTTAKISRIAFIDWCKAFGIPEMFISDGPTNCSKETVRLVCEKLILPRHLAIPYFPWNNGAVERLGEGIVRLPQAILAALQIN